MAAETITNAFSNRILVMVISAIVVLYGCLVAFQYETLEKLVHHGTHDNDAADSKDPHHSDKSQPPDSPKQDHSESVEQDHPDSATIEIGFAKYASVLPFAVMLGAIAILPLIPRTEQWWEKNKNRFLVAAFLATVTIFVYWATEGSEKVTSVLQHAILFEYVPFIVLLFSLYAISGGIRIQGDLPAHPSTNCGFLLVGGTLASFIGTTGAAMLLIRTLIDTNNERKHVQHTVIFFIFIVCNCGGCLLPIGDPPLFLGYLKGVNFMWTFWNLWGPWLFVNVILILLYYLLDRFHYYPHETLRDIQRDETAVLPIKITGLIPNVILLLGVILAVAFLDPNKAIPGTHWHPWPFLREIVQMGLVALSLALGSDLIRRENKFNYHAIVEVAALFIGIFICMQPALEILNIRGPQLPVATATEFFWATGGLSSVLDNAPTYVVFYETANVKFSGTDLAKEMAFTSAVESPNSIEQMRLIGISLGAVFLGAMTYIGNGPNFMVRAIAEQMGIRMPSFFGYVFRYSLIFLTPVFILATFVFF